MLLLSEDAVSESILPLADYLCRENDVRLSLRAAVVRDGSAAELLENDNEVYALSELLDRSAPVSYTHLDVYKRQTSKCAAISPAAIGPRRSSDRISRRTGSLSALKLDVYKRQPPFLCYTKSKKTILE